MAIDINTVVLNRNYGIMSKGEKIKVEVVKINKRAGTVDIKNAAGKVLPGVAVGKLLGLQGRPPAGAKPAAPAPAPKATPKAAAPAAKPAAAPKASKNTPSYADLIERQRDAQNRMADAINELADITDALAVLEMAEPAAPKKGRNQPMVEEDVGEDESDEDEIEFD